jgi:NIMA (never in mitosis gene a)-related kinase
LQHLDFAADDYLSMQYECCMGRHPFEAQNEGALIRKILRGTFTPVSGPCSPALVQLCGQMLAFNPVRRPTAAQLLQMPSVVNQVGAALL